MKLKSAATVLVVLCAGLLTACGDAKLPGAGGAASERNPTSVLGGFGNGAAQSPADAIPPPPGVPRLAKAEVVRSGPDAALAVWLQDGNVVAASYPKAAGWSPAQPL